MAKLNQLNFDNTFSRLSNILYAGVKPTPLPAPYLINFNTSAAELLNLDSAEAQHPDFADYFIGNRLLPGSEPLAMLYAGHQFGQYVPQLGDGRAMLLGEIQNSVGEHWDVQLKGAGPTPFSRRGDGRAVLRSSIREYLCSEAMHSLGIPTTRALCIVGSNYEIYRESTETAAVITRLSPSHVRFGSFEVFYYRKQHQQLVTLADYVIAKHFPHLAQTPDKYPQFLNEVVSRTATLMAKWQAVGFAHGVMNSDNMSILGLTLDYGPFGFMENYDPSFICNHSDPTGRYAYDQQPHIGLWNLACLAQALTPLISMQDAEAALDTYAPAYTEHHMTLMRQKLGLTQTSAQDAPLIATLLQIMHANKIDYTNLFRSLGNFTTASNANNAALRDQFADRPAFDAWAESYGTRLQSEPGTDAERKTRMDKVNPKYILRNYLAQNAITKAEQQDFSEIERLLRLLQRPFNAQSGMEEYAAATPDWAKGIEVSCSS